MAGNQQTGRRPPSDLAKLPMRHVIHMEEVLKSRMDQETVENVMPWRRGPGRRHVPHGGRPHRGLAGNAVAIRRRWLSLPSVQRGRSFPRPKPLRTKPWRSEYRRPRRHCPIECGSQAKAREERSFVAAWSRSSVGASRPRTCRGDDRPDRGARSRSLTGGWHTLIRVGESAVAARRAPDAIE